eukprot:COSAG02_NODE_6727_length_3396_cov_2.243710_3_plen_98_part_00
MALIVHPLSAGLTRSCSALASCAGYTTLRAFVDRMQALPAIKDYLASPRRIPMTVNDEAKAPWSSDGYVRAQCIISDRHYRWINLLSAGTGIRVLHA